MNAAPIIGVCAGCAMLIGVSLGIQGEVDDAVERLETGATKETPKVAIANDAEEAYCTAEFKEVLQRVLHACGLVGQDARRGCQPADVKTFASIDDDDFNALFTPLKDRGAVIMFDDASDKLDDKAKELIDKKWKARKGARYFFIVARASQAGDADFNRKLSQRRANSVSLYIDEVFDDPKLDEKVGRLWLGEEFAQLGKDYCDWNVSRDKQCNEEAINRSAFISWVDCQL